MLYLVISYSIFESSCNKEFKKVIMEVSVLLQSSKMNNTSLTLAIVYAGIPNNILEWQQFF